MNVLLFIFLVWLPVSSILYSVVMQGGEVKNIWKKILLWVLALPSIWFFELNKLAAKFATKIPVINKVATWFKS